MVTIRRKLFIAALAGGLAASLSPARVQAQQPKDTQQNKQTPPSGKPSQPGTGGKQDASGKKAEGQPTVLIGLVTVMPIKSSDPALPGGAKYEMDLENGDAMRSTLASLTGAVFATEGELNDVIDHFVDADRDRLDKQPVMEADFERGQLSKLQGRVNQIKSAWSEKYGEEFEIKENVVYAPLMFAEGEITDAAQFMKKWPVAQGSQKGKSSTGSSRKEEPSERTREQANIEDGRDFGVARFPSEGGLQATTVSFIDEAGGWKIDVPDGMTTSQLRTNLLKELTYIGEHMKELPANKNDAYRMVTHRVANALYGVSSPRT